MMGINCLLMCNRNAPYVPCVADCLLRQSVGVAGGKEISHYVLYRHKFVFCFVFCSSFRFCWLVGVERELYQVQWISSVTANCGGMKTALLVQSVPSRLLRGKRTRCEPSHMYMSQRPGSPRMFAPRKSPSNCFYACPPVTVDGRKGHRVQSYFLDAQV